MNVEIEDLLPDFDRSGATGQKNKKTIGISDFQVSNDPSELLITYSLGSCVGVTIYDCEVRVGGMIHCMLPLSKNNNEKAAETPAMFVDTGIPLLFKAVYELGAVKSRVIIRVAGCSQMMGSNTVFQIGKRNYTILKKLLWKNDLLIKSEDVGKSLSRTLSLDIETGRTYLKVLGKESEL